MDIGIKSFFRSIKTIGITYLAAMFVYQIFSLHFFDFSLYVKYVIGFNVSGSLYYVCLYIQIMIANQILLAVLNKIDNYVNAKCLNNCVWVFEIFLLFIVFFISYFTTNYTNVMDVLGGGGKLFGGTFLIFFYIGMLFERHCFFCKRSFKFNFCMMILFGILWILWSGFDYVNNFQIDRNFPFGIGVNPPGITSLILTLFVLAFIFFLVSFGEGLESKFINRIIDVFQYLGSCSLYIFLYHILFLTFFLNPFVNVNYMFIKRMIYFSVMIAGPVCIKIAVEKLKYFWKKDYRESKENSN